jgi:hypothetical protein
MHVDTDQLDGEYPPEPDCQVNEKNCTFDIDYLCHECGKPLCKNCAVGVRHQPQMFKYSRFNAEQDDRVQMHCPEHANGHKLDQAKLAGGGGGVLLGLLILYLGGVSAITLLIGLPLLVIGGYLLYNEYNLKRNLSVNQISR